MGACTLRRTGAQRAAVHGALACALVLGAALARADEPSVDFVVQSADTLIHLSQTVLVSPDAWREVARLNRLPDANRLQPGQRLRVPTRLLRSQTASASLAGVSGDVRTDDEPAASGTTLREGQSVRTGAGSSAVILLADGSRVTVPPSSLAQLEQSRRFGARDAARSTGSAGDGWFATTMRVVRGSVEVVAARVLRVKPLEVVTPTAVIGVRGTDYRVGLVEGVDATHAEVLDGRVQVDPLGASTGLPVDAGFGASVLAGARSVAVSALLAAPDLSGVPARIERPLVRIDSPAPSDALRVQVAADAGFEQIVYDQRLAAGQPLRVAGLDDARWFLRARRIDAQGIEGYDSVRPFVLKARPEPPVIQAPRSNAKQAVGEVAFAWAANVDAAAVRLQIDTDPAFTQPVQDRADLRDTQVHIELGRPGVYLWRLASVRADGDQGPWSDPQRLELRPAPAAPQVASDDQAQAWRFQWDGRAEDRHDVQLARDPQFADLVAQAQVQGPQWAAPMPERGGRYYFRYRSIEPDGYVSPYSETMRIERPWGFPRWLPLLLVPLLLH